MVSDSFQISLFREEVVEFSSVAALANALQAALDSQSHAGAGTAVECRQLFDQAAALEYVLRMTDPNLDEFILSARREYHLELAELDDSWGQLVADIQALTSWSESVDSLLEEISPTKLDELLQRRIGWKWPWPRTLWREATPVLAALVNPVGSREIRELTRLLGNFVNDELPRIRSYVPYGFAPTINGRMCNLRVRDGSLRDFLALASEIEGFPRLASALDSLKELAEGGLRPRDSKLDAAYAAYDRSLGRHDIWTRLDQWSLWKLVRPYLRDEGVSQSEDRSKPCEMNHIPNEGSLVIRWDEIPSTSGPPTLHVLLRGKRIQCGQMAWSKTDFNAWELRLPIPPSMAEVADSRSQPLVPDSGRNASN